MMTMTLNEASLTEAEAITHVLTYARENRIPFPSVYTKNYEGGAIGVLVEGLDGNQSWISAGAIMSVQQGDVESLVADDIIRFGKPLADRVASIITPKH
jgi:hypothetical protein